MFMVIVQHFVGATLLLETIFYITLDLVCVFNDDALVQ